MPSRLLAQGTDGRGGTGSVTAADRGDAVVPDGVPGAGRPASLTGSAKAADLTLGARELGGLGGVLPG
ncbi:hypothetical protein [Streptomyces roseolus]|uniref:hypothetical protein n=1 Tax=Streptomyces roseolus TaxID=67358 RepID=UPI00167560DD|nr:hypothetical protein [Streptomyces roseolus]GGR19495.1 hypothetical protein GCM10010282_09720 [Streptomyces roseolus]